MSEIIKTILALKKKYRSQFSKIPKIAYMSSWALSLLNKQIINDVYARRQKQLDTVQIPELVPEVIEPRKVLYGDYICGLKIVPITIGTINLYLR